MVGTASAGPTHCTEGKFTAGFNNIFTDAVYIFYVAVFAYSNAVVNNLSEVFEEYRMNVLRNIIICSFCGNDIVFHW